jgi:hypothetical protein
MKVLSEKALLVCDHELGHVQIGARQSLVRIRGDRVLVDNDPETKTIKGCPNTNPLTGILPCRTTLKVESGYSGLVKIDGRRVCLDTVTGRTDGVPPQFHYKVRNPGQQLVASST